MSDVSFNFHFYHTSEYLTYNIYLGNLSVHQTLILCRNCGTYRQTFSPSGKDIILVLGAQTFGQNLVVNSQWGC